MTKTSYATSGTPTADAIQTRARPIAMLAITRTITDHIELARDPNSIGMSIGQQIDAHLGQAASNGVMIQTVAVEFEREDWLDFAATLRGDPRRE